MPQLIPFYFIAQFSAGLFTLLARTFVFGSYLLPICTEILTARVFVSKL